MRLSMPKYGRIPGRAECSYANREGSGANSSLGADLSYEQINIGMSTWTYKCNGNIFQNTYHEMSLSDASLAQYFAHYSIEQNIVLRNQQPRIINTNCLRVFYYIMQLIFHMLFTLKV
jgi:hypothetical protein